jgi:predicted RNase H-like HicB family nuclease
MQLNITIEIWKKEKWFADRCTEPDFVSQGKTRNEARENLLEVIAIQFEEMPETGRLEDYLIPQKGGYYGLG